MLRKQSLLLPLTFLKGLTIKSLGLFFLFISIDIPWFMTLFLHGREAYCVEVCVYVVLMGDLAAFLVYFNNSPHLGIHSVDKTESTPDDEVMSKNRWASIIYRRGQKQLTRLFLREAEHALQLCLKERC